MIRKFISSLGVFFKTNWWIVIIYVIIIASLIHFQPKKNIEWSLFDAILTSSIHFVADIFILMMITEYAENKRSSGSLFQLIAMILFTIAKLYSGIVESNWRYLFADLAFIVAGIKNYRSDVNQKSFVINNLGKFSLICILCLFSFFWYIGNVEHGHELYEISIIEYIGNHYTDLITIVGLLLFAAGLFESNNQKLSDVLVVCGLSFVVAISGNAILGVLDGDHPSGLEISHFLLPLTVLVYKIKTMFSIEYYQPNIPS